MCNTAILMNRGQIVATGEVETILKLYNDKIRAASQMADLEAQEEMANAQLTLDLSPSLAETAAPAGADNLAP